MFDDGALDGEGDVVGEGLGAGVEDADACFARREGKSPESEPARDVVEYSLYVAELGLSRSGGSTGDGGVDCRVVRKLGDWRVSGEGDGEVVDVYNEEEGAEDGSLGNSVGHREGGLRQPLNLQDMERPVR